MSRTREIGITRDMHDKILRVDRLSPTIRTNLTYDCRKVLEKELTDINWLLTEAPNQFMGLRGHRFWFPLEVIMPANPKHFVPSGMESKDILLTVEWLDSMITNLQFIREAVIAYGLRYTKR